MSSSSSINAWRFCSEGFESLATFLVQKYDEALKTLFKSRLEISWGRVGHPQIPMIPRQSGAGEHLIRNISEDVT